VQKSTQKKLKVLTMQKTYLASSLGQGGLDLTEAFFKPIHIAATPSPTKHHTKISVIGAGNVGIAIAQTILTQDLIDEILYYSKITIDYFKNYLQIFCMIFSIFGPILFKK
jgi:hypothetical protein